MKQRLTLIIILSITLVIAGGTIFWSRLATRRFIEEQGLQESISSTGNALQEIQKIKPPLSVSSTLICPFLDKQARVTTETLAIYLPTLLKSSYSPRRFINTPFPGYVRDIAVARGILLPGKKITPEQMEDFRRVFGCDHYIEGEILSSGNQWSVRLIIHKDGKETREETIWAAGEERIMLPSRLARVILMDISGKELPGETVSYLERPAAEKTENLLRAARLFTGAIFQTERVTALDFASLLEIEPDMDWFVPIFLNLLNDRGEALSRADKYARKWKDRPRFQLLYAGFLKGAGSYEQSINISRKVIETIPGSAKAWEVLALSVEKRGKPSDALPFFERMLSLAPDQARTNYLFGYFLVDLAWEYRGTGFANTVSEEGWNKFYENLKRARFHLEKCAALDTGHAMAWSRLITLGMGLDLPKAEVRGFFDNAVRINPDLRNPYWNLQYSMTPKWGGSMEELRDFWSEILGKKIENHYVYLAISGTIWDLSTEHSWDKSIKRNDRKKQKKFLADPDIWPWIYKTYEKFFSDGHEDHHQRAVFGYFAAMADRHELAFDQFEKSNLDFHDEDKRRPYGELLRLYSYSCMRTGHYERGIELARKGLECNLSPDTNKIFQDYIDWAEKKLER